MHSSLFTVFSLVVKECLLLCRNTDGQTPFMQAVSTRAYSIGILLFNVAKQNAMVGGSLDDDAFRNMLYPTGCSADDNPFLLLCCNDTCSFTWTGTDHINQVAGGFLSSYTDVMNECLVFVYRTFVCF